MKKNGINYEVFENKKDDQAQKSAPNKKTQKRFGSKIRNSLNEWIQNNSIYPTLEQREFLSRTWSLTLNQIDHYFSNFRHRNPISTKYGLKLEHFSFR
jgi:hypothetical protein